MRRLLSLKAIGNGRYFPQKDENFSVDLEKGDIEKPCFGERGLQHHHRGHGSQGSCRHRGRRYRPQDPGSPRARRSCADCSSSSPPLPGSRTRSTAFAPVAPRRSRARGWKRFPTPCSASTANPPKSAATDSRAARVNPPDTAVPKSAGYGGALTGAGSEPILRT